MKQPHLLIATLLATGLVACEAQHEHVRSVEELMEQPAILDGIVVRCNAQPDHAKRDRECVNAYAAVERLGQVDDAKQESKRQAQFERSRDKVRLATEQRDAAGREQPFDPYRAPVVQDPAAPAPTGQP